MRFEVSKNVPATIAAVVVVGLTFQWVGFDTPFSEFPSVWETPWRIVVWLGLTVVFFICSIFEQSPDFVIEIKRKESSE